MKRTILNYSTIHNTNGHVVYLGGHSDFTYDRHDFQIRFSHSMEIQRNYDKVHLYHIWHFGKLTKFAAIYNRFDGTFDVDIHEVRNFGKHEFRRNIYAGNFHSLKYAVKMLYQHYKKD